MTDIVLNKEALPRDYPLNHTFFSNSVMSALLFIIYAGLGSNNICVTGICDKDTEKGTVFLYSNIKKIQSLMLHFSKIGISSRITLQYILK